VFVAVVDMLSRITNLRREPRRLVRYSAWLRIDQDSPLVRCVLWDISDGGARIAVADPKALPERFTLMLTQQMHRQCQVRWRDERFVGVKFVE
jgi:c-di-GMP-binding flagellar brake protein YcgR